MNIYYETLDRSSVEQLNSINNFKSYTIITPKLGAFQEKVNCKYFQVWYKEILNDFEIALNELLSEQIYGFTVIGFDTESFERNDTSLTQLSNNSECVLIHKDSQLFV